MKTEQVTLTVAHDENDRLGSASGWEWQTMVDATIGQDSESPVEVRVVEQPRGWLTGEEREAVEASREFWQVECESTLGDDADRRYLAALSNLLARSTPPEVVLPMDEIVWNEEGRRVRRLNPIKVREALTSQGILFKEAT